MKYTLRNRWYDCVIKFTKINKNGGTVFIIKRVNFIFLIISKYILKINLAMIYFLYNFFSNRVVEKVKYFSNKDPGIISTIL